MVFMEFKCLFVVFLELIDNGCCVIKNVCFRFWLFVGERVDDGGCCLLNKGIVIFLRLCWLECGILCVLVWVLWFLGGVCELEVGMLLWYVVEGWMWWVGGFCIWFSGGLREWFVLLKFLLFLFLLWLFVVICEGYFIMRLGEFEGWVL